MEKNGELCNTAQEPETTDKKHKKRTLIAMSYEGLHPGHDKYMSMQDAEIVLLAQGGDGRASEFMLAKYKNFVRAKARSYYLIGADREDIVQEGMIGLYKAIRDYKSEKQITFRSFAEMCITRQMITAIKTATRLKHRPLNSYVSFNKPVFDEDSECTLIDVITVDEAPDPEEIIIDREDYAHIETRMSEILSDLERKVLSLYLEGISYQQIAVKLNKQVKSVDNAIQRVKIKMERYLEEQKDAR